MAARGSMPARRRSEPSRPGDSSEVVALEDERTRLHEAAGQPGGLSFVRAAIRSFERKHRVQRYERFKGVGGRRSLQRQAAARHRPLILRAGSTNRHRQGSARACPCGRPHAWPVPGPRSRGGVGAASFIDQAGSPWPTKRKAGGRPPKVVRGGRRSRRPPCLGPRPAFRSSFVADVRD